MERFDDIGWDSADASASTDGAAATFRRNGSSASLTLEYDVDGGTADLDGDDLGKAIAELCREEVETMREKLTALGEELASQLNDDGRKAAVRRTWSDQWSRKWKDGGNSFSVEGAHTRMNDSISVAEGTSDASLVLETVAQFIDQRTQNIRSMYGTIMMDAYMRRGNDAFNEAN